MDVLEAKTERVNIKGVMRFATPLLRMRDAPPLRANKETVLPNLRGTEKHLSKDPEKAKTYEAEIQKLLDAGSAVKLPSEDLNKSQES